MHPRNRFRTGYDVPTLIASSPALEPFARTSPRGEDTINFADPSAVMALNQALLKDAYGLRWSIPRGALCPPIPSRCDYIHHLADLLSGGDDAAIPRGRAVRVLDIGTGANCIYPLLAPASMAGVLSAPRSTRPRCTRPGRAHGRNVATSASPSQRRR